MNEQNPYEPSARSKLEKSAKEIPWIKIGLVFGLVIAIVFVAALAFLVPSRVVPKSSVERVEVQYRGPAFPIEDRTNQETNQESKANP